MDEERAYELSARLRPVLEADLAPDAAGSTSLALALLAVRAEESLAGEDGAEEARAALPRDIEQLPAFIEAERDHGVTDDLTVLVPRFVRGERARPAPAHLSPEAAAAARRYARLRELRREGVDLSLIEANLALTPMQRIANMEHQLRLVRRLERARRAHAAKR